MFGSPRKPAALGMFAFGERDQTASQSVRLTTIMNAVRLTSSGSHQTHNDGDDDGQPTARPTTVRISSTGADPSPSPHPSVVIVDASTVDLRANGATTTKRGSRSSTSSTSIAADPQARRSSRASMASRRLGSFTSIELSVPNLTKLTPRRKAPSIISSSSSQSTSSSSSRAQSPVGPPLFIESPSWRENINKLLALKSEQLMPSYRKGIELPKIKAEKLTLGMYHMNFMKQQKTQQRAIRTRRRGITNLPMIPRGLIKEPVIRESRSPSVVSSASSGTVFLAPPRV